MAEQQGKGVWSFTAMGSPCEVLVDADAETGARLTAIAEAEALRIEHKFSRYRTDSIVTRINLANGEPVELDAETASLIDYAAQCHALSDGLFDITSGVLRRAWTFDGSDKLPEAAAVAAILPLVGWGRADWSAPVLRLPPGMQADLGGLGKEYAVDRALQAVVAESDAPVLVNFGGDLRASGPRADGSAWSVAIDAKGEGGKGEAMLALAGGALATSGDARRYLLKDGVRYSHILDPRTGWPVKDPPRSVTVAAPTCMEAGVLSTFAMLQGAGAEDFLRAQDVRAWCVR